MRNNQKLKFKRNVNINSLQAAICNVALFKTMKQKDFKDTIFISYNQKGVILQAINQKQWIKANQYILSFIKNKKIEVLTYGHEKEIYQDLINKHLKQYTRKLKEKQIQCPYINLIHYQRLRKSCEYMDKQKYVEPLQAWQKKNKATPNFAYLVVEPKQRFEQVKLAILEMLRGNEIPIKQLQLKCKQFLHLFCNSQHANRLRDLYDKRQIEIKGGQNRIHLTIYCQYESIVLAGIKVMEYDKKLKKSGYQIIKNETINRYIEQCQQTYFQQQTDIFVQMKNHYTKNYGNDYCFVIYGPKQHRPILEERIKNLLAVSDLLLVKQKLNKHIVCDWRQIAVLEKKYQNEDYICYTSILNSCYMIIHEYNLQDEQLEGFLIYLEQLLKYYNASLVRYYGICVQGSSYRIIFDYKNKRLDDLIKNNELIDEIQVATIILEILHAINFLHTHEDPRCLGQINKKCIFYPTCLILPYLKDEEEQEYSFESDIKIVGQLFDELVDDPNEQIESIISQMICENSFKRLKMSQAILRMQDIINN